MKKIWTPERLKLLRELCDMGMKSAYIAKRMNLKKNQVRNGMKIYKISNGRADFEKGHSIRPKKQYRPADYNPGAFKKGHTPKHALPDGTKRIRKGQEKIRVNGKWIAYIKFIWEQVNGPVPKGHIVVRKDRNKEVTLDNVELISKAENIRRNRNPEKMSQTKRAKYQKATALYNPKEIPWYLNDESLNRRKNYKQIP